MTEDINAMEKHKIDINVTERSKPNFLTHKNTEQINFKFPTLAMIMFSHFFIIAFCYGHKEVENIAKVWLFAVFISLKVGF